MGWRRRTGIALCVGALAVGAVGSAIAETTAATAALPVRTVAGSGRPGFAGDGGPAAAALLSAPSAIARDRQGDLFIADTGNCRVREVLGRGSTSSRQSAEPGTIVTVAGGPCGRADPPPAALAIDTSGDLFIAYPTANRVTVLAAHSGTVLGTAVAQDRQITVAGNGVAGDSGDGGPAGRAELDDPSGVATDAAGDLFLSDTANCRVRMVAASPGVHDGVAAATGDIVTVAGTGICGSAGDGGPATAAQVWDPGALTTDALGDLFVADQGNRTVRVLAPQATVVLGTAVGAGDLATVAGEGSYGPYLVDGLSAIGQVAELNFPSGLALDPSGDLLIADGQSHVIREVTNVPALVRGKSVPAGAMVTVAGAISYDVRHVTTTWLGTKMVDPVGIVVTPTGSVLYADQGTDQVRSLLPGFGPALRGDPATSARRSRRFPPAARAPRAAPGVRPPSPPRNATAGPRPR